MNIAVVGTGYVGLVTGTCFAETGNNVFCVDINEEKVKMLRAGKVPIFEPGLDLLFERNIAAGRLRFTTSLEEGIEEAQIIFLALPTPPGANGSADLRFVLQVAEQLGPMLKEYTVVVDKSTVPVGTADLVREKVALGAKVPFDVVSNPEFLREGVAVEDFMKPDRVVIGASSEGARKVMEKLYAPFVRQGNPIVFMDERSAELTKYAANAFLATKITFMNEVANLCEKVGANVDDVRRGIGSDNRIGKRFLFAGIGYGGSCFPKDVQALAHTSDQYGYDFKILKAVMDINDRQKVKLVPQVLDYFGGDLKGRRIAMWGLAFKPNTDDIREAPALYNIEALKALGAEVVAHDPEAMDNVRRQMGEDVKLETDAYLTLEGADALMIMTEWPLFRTPDFDRMKTLMKGRAIFDGRNLFEPNEVQAQGFDYFSIGRKSTVAKNLDTPEKPATASK